MHPTQDVTEHADVSQVHTNVNIPPPHPTQDVTEHADVSQVHTNVNIPLPTPPKTWRSMRMCRKFTRTVTWRDVPTVCDCKNVQNAGAVSSPLAKTCLKIQPKFRMNDGWCVNEKLGV